MSDLDRLTAALVQTRRLDDVTRQLDTGLPVDEVAILRDLVTLERLTPNSFKAEARALSQDGRVLRLFCARFLIDGSGRSDYESAAQVLEELGNEQDDPLLLDWSKLSRARSLILADRHREAIAALESIHAAYRTPNDILEALTMAWTGQWYGFSLMRLGDFRRANELLRESVEVAREWGLCTQWTCRYTLGSLLLESGQFREALKICADEEARAASRVDGDTRGLIHSHLTAAQAALYMGVTSKAGYELGEAKDLLDEHHHEFPDLEANLVLYSAKLDTMWGNVDEGIHLYEYAIELFEKLDPPHIEGALNAKYHLIEFALQARDYATVFARLGELLAQAEEHGCVRERTRLLAFKARLCLDDMAPADKLRAAYDDLTSRLHLMNNPRLTFMAYADLYAYARRHLDAREQEFWLDRLRALEPLLEQSCYRDLYEAYVLERYRDEIEGGLRDLGDLRPPGDD